MVRLGRSGLGSNPSMETTKLGVFMFYKGVEQQKGSPVYEALKAGDKKLAEKLFKENTAKYNTQYSQEDRDWFAATAKEFADKAKNMGVS